LAYIAYFASIDASAPFSGRARPNSSKQSVNDLLGDLERTGYLERKPHPDDGRGRVVRLTPRGKRLERATHEISRELEADWAAQIGPERIASLKQTLGDMLASS
jgi:DNA-binding MarR family transcriptional regulator